MMTIVSNTGPLLHLYEIGALDLLRLTGAVYIPPRVQQELSFLAPDLKMPEWLAVKPLQESFEMQAAKWQVGGLLDLGEASALELARQENADWFLTDDAAARLVASSFGLAVHGSLGIVLWAGAQGHLSHTEAWNLLDKLAQSSLWLSARILREARQALDEIFK